MECRSWTLYHFVNGTLVPVGAAPNANPAKGRAVVEAYEAGSGSGAPAKSAKSTS